MSIKNKIKVVFPLNSNDWHHVGSESVWAEIVNDNQALIKNTPFYVKGVSYEDIVNFKIENNGKAMFDSVARQGGHSTYRLIINKKISKDQFSERWNLLKNLGCTYEHGNIGLDLYAVDVPPGSDMQKIYKLFEDGENDGIWNFEEGNFEKN